MAQLNLVGKRCRFEAIIRETRAGSNAYFAVSYTGFSMNTDVDKPNNIEFQRKSSFDIVPGLAGVGISFRCMEYPDRYIRHADNNIHIHSFRDNIYNDTFDKDCSWIPELGLRNSTIGVSFRSVNYPSKYLYHDWNNKYTLETIHFDSDVFKTRVTWIPHIVGIPQVNGRWKLVYSNDNAVTSGEYTAIVDEGITIQDTTSSSTTEVQAWKKTVEGGAEYLEGIGGSLKYVFENSGSTSVTTMSSHLFRSTETSITGFKFNLVKGTPFYLWQWEITAVASDGTYVTLKTSQYKQTTTATAPEKYVGNWANV